MAIYSLHHSSVGKSTQALRYTAGAHVEYITRASALTRIEGSRMPTDTEACVSYLKQGEDRDRANARVIDKMMLALPRELNQMQRAALVRDFAEDVTQGRAGWLAAFHEGGKDEANPHVHLVVRDRDAVSGKRVAKLSEKGSTERLRQLWEDHANRHLAMAQRPERIDRRTLKAQGIDRRPTIHEGVRGRRLERGGRRIQSRSRRVRNAALARSSHRDVNYAAIDEGRSRGAYNKAMRQRIEASHWSDIDADGLQREMAARGETLSRDAARDWLAKRKMKKKKQPGGL